MKTYPGVVPGIVESLEDPMSEGRIQVSFPWLPYVTEKPWAPVAVPFAGKERGTFFSPELRDEVLVAFEHGSFDHPFIVGFLWNGKDKPPNEDINFSVRRIRTVSGHILEFDDNEGEERVYIKTQGGHEIELKDSDSALVKIKTIKEQEIQLDDESDTIFLQTGDHKITMEPNGITLETEADVTIKGTNINIEATAAVAMSGANVDIEATSQLTAKGNPIHLNP
jgi:uncharacterized protein involved in type VI secretion and phage assembly